jgi:hypothetical protein
MSNEQKATQWVDSMAVGQNGGSKRVKSSGRRAEARRFQDRRDRPLNVLGCFALIHAIRSMESGKRSGIGTARATVA